MAFDQDPPIQERTTEESGMFPQIWQLWFADLKDALNNIDGGTP